MNMNQKGVVNIISVIIIVVLVAGAVGYFAFIKKSEPINQKLTPPAPAALQNEAANWKTYQNEKYDYIIKYPPAWYVDTADSNTEGGVTHWSNYENPERYSVRNIPKPNDLYVLTMSVLKITPTDTLDKITEEFLAEAKVRSKNNVQVNNLNGVRAEVAWNVAKAGEDYIQQTITILKSQDKIFYFSYGESSYRRGELPDTALATMEKITGSFMVR